MVPSIMTPGGNPVIQSAVSGYMPTFPSTMLFPVFDTAEYANTVKLPATPNCTSGLGTQHGVDDVFSTSHVTTPSWITNTDPFEQLDRAGQPAVDRLAHHGCCG